MRTVKRVLAVLILLAGTAVLSSHGGEPKKDKDRDNDKVHELMLKKLQHSQKILEGVSVGDFDLIAQHAEDLIDLSKEVEWKVLKTPQYEIHSNDFRRTAEDLIKNARKKNLDAAALSYVELTLDCVRCHKYVREVRDARNDPQREPAERLAVVLPALPGE